MLGRCPDDSKEKGQKSRRLVVVHNHFLRISEAKTCKNYECMRQVRCNYLGPYLQLILGSLSNDGGSGEGNENGKKAVIGLDIEENNNFARESRFLYISLPSLDDYDGKMPNFTSCGGREHKTMTFFFFS